jgi:hypothetical protein
VWPPFVLARWRLLWLVQGFGVSGLDAQLGLPAEPQSRARATAAGWQKFHRNLSRGSTL